MVVARADGQVTLRTGLVVTLEPTVLSPSGVVVARCQGIANRFDRDPSGGLAGQCTKPATTGNAVCDTHGARAPQVVAAARRRLAEASGDVAERLVGAALSGKVNADTLRAMDSVLDRSGVPRATAIEVGQTRAGIGERLDALELSAAESPGEGPDTGDAGRQDSGPVDSETVDAQDPTPDAAGHDVPADPGSVSDRPESGSAPA